MRESIDLQAAVPVVESSGGRAPAEASWSVRSQPLLLTKLRRPSLASDCEKRVRLLERLAHHEQRALTLISAPAGYGKTALASAWVAGLDTPTAWLSLDKRDDDLQIFASYLVEAARSAFPGAVLRTAALLQAPVLPAAVTLARYFVHDLEQTGARLVLVLDDLHCVRDPDIFDFLIELLRHPLPSLHLVVIARRDPPLPIAVLRGRGQVLEIRARDLQLSPEETGRLLGALLGRQIDEATAAAWTERTEGWVTALRLVALALHGRGAADAIGVDTLGHRQFVHEYLLADVVSHLPAVQREWLLKTAILDRFCAPLCEALCVSERANGSSELTGKAFVRWLQDNNLFIVALDDEGCWFRFHHLFAELLRELLVDQYAPVELRALYRRASGWFDANDLAEEAIRLALAGGEAAAGARLVERRRYALMNAEQWSRLHRWLRLLPAETVAASVLLTNAKGFLSVQRSEPTETMTAIQQSTRLLAALPPESEEASVARAELGVLTYLPSFQAGRFGQAAENARRSLAALPAEALFVRSLATSVLSSALHLGGRPQEALAVLLAALADSAWPPRLHARFHYYLCTEYYLRGNLVGVLAAATECLRIATELELPELAGWGLYYLGTAHYARDEFAEAEGALLELIEHRMLAGPVTVAFGVFALALIRQAQGRDADASDLIQMLRAFLQDIEHRDAALLVESFRVELALRAGRRVVTSRPFTPDFAVRLPRWHFYAPQLTSLQTSVSMIPYTLSIFASAVLIVRSYRLLAPRWIARIAFILVAAGLTILAFAIRGEWGQPGVVLGLIVLGLGEGSLLTLLFNVLVTSSPKELAGDVGALRGVANNLSTALGTAFASVVAVSLLTLFVSSALVGNPTIPPSLKEQVALDNIDFVSNDQLVQHLATATDATASQKAEAVRINTEARAQALKASFLILAAIALLAILPAGGLPGYKPEEIPSPDAASATGSAGKDAGRKPGAPAPAA